MENLNIIIVTQARIGSSRFPEKVLKPLGNSTMLGIHLNRLNQSKLATKIIVATTFEDKIISIRFFFFFSRSIKRVTNVIYKSIRFF